MRQHNAPVSHSPAGMPCQMLIPCRSPTARLELLIQLIKHGDNNNISDRMYGIYLLDVPHWAYPGLHWMSIY